MCGQVTSSALGLGAGGRSPGYLTRKSRSTRTKATTRVGQVRKPRAHLEQQLDSTVILIGVIGLPTLLACQWKYRAHALPIAIRPPRQSVDAIVKSAARFCGADERV